MEDINKKLITKEHDNLKNYWCLIGKSLGYSIQKEFKVEGGFIDVIWKKDKEFIYIEIEEGNFGPQQEKNINKCLKANPTLIIFDIRHDKTYNDFKNYLKNNKTCRIELINRDSLTLNQEKISSLREKHNNLLLCFEKNKIMLNDLLNWKEEHVNIIQEYDELVEKFNRLLDLFKEKKIGKGWGN